MSFCLFVFGSLNAVHVAQTKMFHIFCPSGDFYFFLCLQRDLNVMTVDFLFCQKNDSLEREQKAGWCGRRC